MASEGGTTAPLAITRCPFEALRAKTRIANSIFVFALSFPLASATSFEQHPGYVYRAAGEEV